MKLLKNAIAATVLAAAVICAVSACTGKQPEARGGRTRIKVAVWNITQGLTYESLVKAFAASHPDINVEIIDIPSNDYTQKLSIMLNGGSDVDAFWIKDGDTTKGLSNRGQLADLSAFVERDNIDLSVFNGLGERFIIDGKLVALPTSTSYYVNFYNRALFDKADIPYPSNDMTWGQFERLALDMTSGTGKNKVYGAHLHTWQACVQNWAIQDGKHTIVETDYSFMKPYYEMALRLQDAGAIMDFGSLKSGNIAYSNAFFNGNVAMIPMGFWMASGIKERIDNGEIDINWGVATLPHPEGVPAGWTVGSVTPLCINQASKNKEAAWEFVKFITSEEGASIYAKYAQFPSRANSDNLAEIANVPGMPEGLLEALLVKNIAIDRPMQDFVGEINQMLGEEHSLIMLKELSVDKGLAAMAKRSKEIQGK